MNSPSALFSEADGEFASGRAIIQRRSLMPAANPKTTSASDNPDHRGPRPLLCRSSPIVLSRAWARRNSQKIVSNHLDGYRASMRTAAFAVSKVERIAAVLRAGRGIRRDPRIERRPNFARRQKYERWRA
jgi:hypothetical protein